MKKLGVAQMLFGFVLVLPFVIGAQQSKVPKPILEARGNIDSELSFVITASEGGRDCHADISLGLPVDAENYRKLPTQVRTVACNIAVPRSDLGLEKMDLAFCRKYYVGW